MGGVSRFSIGKILSHSAENFCRGSFTVAVFLGTGKVWIRRGEYQVFPSKKFCLTVPKILVEQSFPVALIQGTEKVWLRGGGEYQDIPWNLFLFHSAEKIRWGTI